MRRLAAVVFGLMNSVVAAEPTKTIAPHEVSLGAVRVTDDLLQRNGLTADRSWQATGVLLAWMHDAGTLNDKNLRKAVIPLVIMLRKGGIDANEMKSLCTVAPRCIDYMAVGAALNPPAMQAHLRRGDLEARSAIMNMIVAAGLDHTGKGEWTFVDSARQLKVSSPRKRP